VQILNRLYRQIAFDSGIKHPEFSNFHALQMANLRCIEMPSRLSIPNPLLIEFTDSGVGPQE